MSFHSCSTSLVFTHPCELGLDLMNLRRQVTEVVSFNFARDTYIIGGRSSRYLDHAFSIEDQQRTMRPLYQFAGISTSPVWLPRCRGCIHTCALAW